MPHKTPLMRHQINDVFGCSRKEAVIGDVVYLHTDTALTLECGVKLSHIPVAFQTYGYLNAERSNAILICHALTGDQYVASPHPVTGKPGWWEDYVGAGKIIDTNRFYVICANVLGSCMGTLGPKSLNPDTGRPYGLHFPVITIADMVHLQASLLDALGIEQLFAVIGGSMGGMQVLNWCAEYPKRVFAAMPIATTSRHSPQNIAFHEVGRQAVMADPGWNKGEYWHLGSFPEKGLAVARMTAHVTYLSQETLQRKFGRSLQDISSFTFGFDADFQVESYLRHQGVSFIERFDPNSYLYITRAMDYFDLSAAYNGQLASAFANTPTRFCVVSFSSDWLFPAEDSRHITRALNAAGAAVSFSNIDTDKGHDAFLLDVPEFKRILHGFLEGAATVRGV